MSSTLAGSIPSLRSSLNAPYSLIYPGTIPIRLIWDGSSMPSRVTSFT